MEKLEQKYYKIVTYGCQMNEHDSERIAYLLEQMGYCPTEDREEANILLYNTCLIRENAEWKVYGQLGALKHWKEQHPDRILAVSGCMMQTGPARDVIRKKYNHVDIIFGTRNIAKLPFLVDRFLQTGQPVCDISDYQDEQNLYERRDAHFAYINITTGCNNFCTYCVVPYARGREESRDADSILAEVRALGRRGYKEVMLLGQNVNSYRCGNLRFPDLLRQVNEVPGIERIRFMSSHPKDLSEELIAAMATCEKVENHFHLPLQSGSDKVLHDMNRHYDRARYLDLVKKLRNAMPSIALSTDIIVGFPGETEADHRETMALCQEVEFDSAFTFLYSARPGTPAAKRDDPVPEETASRRFQELLDVLYPIFLKKNQADVGKLSRVLVESVSKNDPEKLTGRNAENKLVHFPGSKEWIGQMVDVRITDCTSFALSGRLEKREQE
uniref:tRNA (N6-isopentenyl adenosine(37)-C2)-methylthiotransferase MiaB n=1 Tax=Ndongobacter massiliensis TaxID=1871025 RepID=UPI0009310CCA|nr:tRNA (N6-isopentenyl adenosine(37)-C2)-methylthiotransferase MiaB [Ndongobacter massiliensis]